MPSIPIDDLVYRDPTVRAGVTLAKAEDVSDKRVMSLADFDFRVPSDRPGEAAPIRLTEGYICGPLPGAARQCRICPRESRGGDEGQADPERVEEGPKEA